jgi:hypothetical protein
MTAEEMIQQLIELYPAWESDEHVASMRVRGIKKLIRQAYEEGKDAGVRRAKAEQALIDIGKNAGYKPEESDLFGKLFGFKK